MVHAPRDTNNPTAWRPLPYHFGGDHIEVAPREIPPLTLSVVQQLRVPPHQAARVEDVVCTGPGGSLPGHDTNAHTRSPDQFIHWLRTPPKSGQSVRDAPSDTLIYMTDINEAETAVEATRTAAFEAQKVFLRALGEEWQALASQEFKRLALELQPETTQAHGAGFKEVRTALNRIITEGSERIPELFGPLSPDPPMVWVGSA